MGGRRYSPLFCDSGIEGEGRGCSGPAFLYEEGGKEGGEMARSTAPMLPQHYGSTLIDKAAS